MSEIKQDDVLYNETIVTGNDFRNKIKDIKEVLENCCISDIKHIYEGAMKAQGTEPDMARFEPFKAVHVDFLVGQIGNAISNFDYETLFRFHEYVINLRDIPVSERE